MIKSEFIRNQALEDQMDFYAKRMCVKLIIELDKGCCNFDVMVLALEKFAPMLKEELSHFLTSIEISPELFAK